MKADRIIPVLALVLIHFIYFAIAQHYKGIYNGDSIEYLHTADNLLSHFTSYNGFLIEPLNPGYYSLRPPGYPLFILFSKLVCSNDWFLLAVQNLLSILFLSAIYFKLHSVFTSKIYRLLFYAGLLLFPVYLIMVNMVAADIVLGFLLILSWFCIEKYCNTWRWKYLLLYNVILCCAVMVKPVMMYFWIPNLAFSGFLSWKIKKTYPVIMSLLLVFCVASWSYRNYYHTGYFHFSSIKMQNMLELNAGSVLSYRYNQEEMLLHRKSIFKVADTIESYRDRSLFILGKAKEIISENPGLYLLLHVKGMFNFFLAPGGVDIRNFVKEKSDNSTSLSYEIEKKGLSKGIIAYYNHTNLSLLIILIAIGLWNVISSLLLLAAFGSNQINKYLRFYFFILILYLAFVCGPGGCARFKTSIYPIYLYLLPYGSIVIKNIWTQFIATLKIDRK